MPKPSNYAKFFDVYLQQEVPEKYEGDISLTCPFDDCQKEEHFKANCDNGLWHCVKCDEGGNARALITKIHAQALSHTTDAQWKLLASLRGIAWDILRDSGFAYDVSNDRWLVPYYTYDPVKEEFTDFLNNLGYFYPSSKDPKSQFVIKKAPQLPVYLYNPGIHYTPPLSSRSIVWEGEWDTLAYYDAVRDTPDLVLGKPGAGFPIAALETLSQCKELVLGLDNDMSGRKQTAVAIKTVQQGAPKLKLRVLDWSIVPEPPKDLRDLWTDKKRKGSMIKDISAAIVPYDEAEDELIDNTEIKVLTAGYVEDATVYPLITSFGTYIDKTKTRLHVTEETQLAMAATFAITTSIDLRGEPLWGFLRGPASSGKTTFIESFGGKNQWFDNLSKVTAESFVSGWRDETGDEPSFLPTLTDPIPKTLFIKDFTTTLMDTAEKQQKVFGLLTDIYDGHVKIHYGNNQTREFHNTYFNMVAGVTDILDAYSSASIGERFMRIDWLGRDYDPREYGRRALDNFGQTIDQKIALTEWTLGFVRHLRSLELSTTVEEMYKEPILDLADFISIVRTKVETDRYEGMKYKPRPELPSRLAKLLAKLFVSSRVVMGSSELAFKVVRKVAIDTCYGFPLDIVRFILANPNTVREEIAIGTNIHPQRAYRVITDLCTTGVLKQGLQTSTRKNGRKRHIFYINPKLLPALYPEAHLHDSQPVTKQRRITSPNNGVRTGRSQPPRRNT